MSNFSTLFGGEKQSGAAFVTPEELPRFYGDPSMKTTNTTVVGANAAGFNSAITTNGFGAVASIVGADTYVTVCDVTGSGVLYYAISPGYQSTTIGHGATLRITIDGDVYTIQHTTTLAPASADRLILGPLTPITNSGSGPETPMSPNIANDYGFHTNSRMNGGITRLHVGSGIILPHWIESLDLPRCKFKTNMKVEAKADVLGVGEYVKAMAIYTLRT